MRRGGTTASVVYALRILKLALLAVRRAARFASQAAEKAARARQAARAAPLAAKQVASESCKLFQANHRPPELNYYLFYYY